MLRLVARHLKTAHQVMVRAVMAAQMTRDAAATVDPAGRPQLSDAEATVWWSPTRTAVQSCADSHPGGWAEFVAQALELLHELVCLPPLQVLIPIPGAAGPGPGRTARSTTGSWPASGHS
jgi:hypothetical protein